MDDIVSIDSQCQGHTGVAGLIDESVNQSILSSSSTITKRLVDNHACLYVCMYDLKVY